MGFLNKLFGGSNGSDDRSSGVSVSYPERFVMAPDLSPLLKNGEAFLSTVIEKLGLKVNPSECLDSAIRAVSQCSDSKGLWKSLANEAIKRAGGWDSRAESLARALWILCAPLNEFPVPEKNDQVALEVLRRLALLMADADLDVSFSEQLQSLYFTGNHGHISYGVSAKGFWAPDGSTYVEIVANAYIGYFMDQAPYDGKVFLNSVSRVLSRYFAPLFVSPRDVGAKTIFALSVEDVQDARIRPLEMWLGDFANTLVAADVVASRFVNQGPTVFKPKGNNMTRGKADSLAERVNFVLDHPTSEHVCTENLISLVSKSGLVGFRIKAGQLFAKWGDDLCPVSVEHETCILRIPLSLSYANLAAIAFSLNEDAEPSVWTNGPARWFIVTGAWTVIASESSSDGDDLAFVIRTNTSNDEFLARAAIEIGRQLKRLSRRIKSDRSLSYLRILKTVVGEVPLDIQKTFFPTCDYPHVNPRRRGAGPETEAEKRERLEREAREERRKRAIAQGKSALFAGDGKEALSHFQVADKNSLPYQTYVIEKTLAYITAKDYEGGLTAAVPLYDTNRPAVTVLCGFAHRLNGNEAEASRHFKRAVDLL
jgi:hypothetical protein